LVKAATAALPAAPHMYQGYFMMAPMRSIHDRTAAARLETPDRTRAHVDVANTLRSHARQAASSTRGHVPRQGSGVVDENVAVTLALRQLDRIRAAREIDGLDLNSAAGALADLRGELSRSRPVRETMTTSHPPPQAACHLRTNPLDAPVINAPCLSNRDPPHVLLILLRDARRRSSPLHRVAIVADRFNANSGLKS